MRALFDVNLLIALFQPDHVHQEQRAVASRWKSRRRSATSPAWPRPTTQLGRVAHHRGDLTSAENWSWKSLEINEARGNQPGMALNYHQLGIVAQLRDDLTEAEAWYRKSLEIKEALGDRPGMALTYGQLGC